MLITNTDTDTIDNIQVHFILKCENMKYDCFADILKSKYIIYICIILSKNFKV